MGALRYAGAGALAAAAAVVIADGGPSATAQDSRGREQRRPNIVVVMTDDQDLASVAKMPTVLGRLGAKGATFTNSFTNWPLCCPSRATFYTGQYAHNHGVIGNTPPLGGFIRFNDTSTLPVWLQQAGYRTIHVGKYLNGYGQDGNDPAYVPPGWDEWNAATAGTGQSVYDYVINRNGSLVNYGSAESDFKQDVFTDLAVEAVNRNAPRGPFFLGVMYTAPHGGGPNPSPQPPDDCRTHAKPAPRHAAAFDSEPLPRPPGFNEADVSDKPAGIRNLPSIAAEDVTRMQRRYRCRLESLLSVDEGVGRIVDALAAAGELNRTMIVFTSDNGFFAGEHRVQNGKNRAYEEGIRVPLVIRGPGIPADVTVDDLAINADLAPTVLDAAGASAGLPADGRSLLSAMADPDRLRGRELLLEKGDIADGDDDDTPQSATFAAVRTRRYVYVNHGTGELELYDLELDPYQLQNVILDPAYDKVEAALATRLAALRRCAADSCRRRPDLRLKPPRSVRDGGRSCRPARGFVVRMRGSAARRLVEASFTVGAKRVAVDRSAPFKRRLPARLLRSKRRPELRAVGELRDGRALSVRKRVRVCR